jgi:hypothetical protein
MTKRNLIAAGVVTGLILIAVVAVIRLINWWVDLPEPPPFKIVSLSPQRAYAITVERKRREPDERDWTSWKIYFGYASQGRRALNDVMVADGDSSSGPGYPKNPQLNWVYENTFRLSNGSSLPESTSNLLLVRNDSANALSYLIVRGGWGEWFYILNLASHASLKLYALPDGASGALSWTSADGQFINGRNVGKEQSFKIPPSATGPGCYCLSVKEDGITIVSRDFDAWDWADFTPEEKRQMEEYRKKREAGQTTQSDEEANDKIYSNRPEVITPKSPDCGAANVASSRP